MAVTPPALWILLKSMRDSSTELPGLGIIIIIFAIVMIAALREMMRVYIYIKFIYIYKCE